jgi:hypothetical protein
VVNYKVLVDGTEYRTIGHLTFEIRIEGNIIIEGRDYLIEV